MDRTVRLAVVLAFCMLFVDAAAALSIGVSPGNIDFKDLMRGGYAEDNILVSTSGNETLNITISARDEISSWLVFEPSSLILQPHSTANIQVMIRPPGDIANGVYNGIASVSARPNATSGVAAGAGMTIGVAAAVKIAAEVTDNEIKTLSIKDITVKDVEELHPTEITVMATNTGNVKIRPRIVISIYDQAQENVLKSLEYSDTEILPTSDATMLILIPLDDFKIGQYWVSVMVFLDETAIYSRVLTFDYLERGSLRVKGEFNSISAGAWVQVGDVVKLDASFTNTGQMITTAKAKFEIYLGDALKDVVESEELQVDVAETKNLVAYYKPVVDGRYEIKSVVSYSRKITEEKSTILNVRPIPLPEVQTPVVEQKTDYMPYILMALVVIIIILAAKSFHIRHTRKKTSKE